MVESAAVEASGGGAGHVVAERYRLVALMGQGGFGEVWDAEDLVLGERVALKRLRAPGPESPWTRREIATLRLLHFPGTVRLFDEGEDEGQPFFVMERVSGTPFPGLVSDTAGDLRTNGPPVSSSADTVPATRASDTLSATATASSSQAWSRAPEAAGAAKDARAQRQARYAWSSIAKVTEALLDTLRRVHAAGFVHRDLKPANVLVRPDGQPVILDFGLCLPTAEGARLPHGSQILGTPAYLAPEQVRGGPIDARADLYAVGVMLYEALTGCLPHDASTVATLLALRASHSPVPVRAREPSIPPEVADVVDRLLAVSAADRPPSAADVLERLRGSTLGPPPPAWSLPEGSGPCDEIALRALFAGRDRLFHEREDAARALWNRTRGDPALVRAEIDAWVSAGVARLDGGQILLDRDALDRWAAGLSIAQVSAAEPPAESRRDAWREAAAARAPGEAGRLVALVAAGQDAEAAEEARIRARSLAEQGRLGLSVAALAEGLSASRRREPSSSASVEAALLTEWVKVAFAERRPHALDRALYEVCRARERSSPAVARLEGLLRAAISARTFLSSEPAAAADALNAFDDPGLERWRHWVRIRSRMYSAPGAAEQSLADAEAWAERTDDPEARAAVAGLRGSLCFVRGRFSEAAQWHAAAAEGERWLSLRITQMLNGAAALLEAFEPVRAREVAEQAAALAAACRHPYFEGRAEWTARAAAYRAGTPMTPDVELVEAHAELEVPDMLGTTCLTEAAIAFRVGDRAAAAALAARAAATWQRSGQHYPAMLARALAGAMGEGLSLEEAERLGALAARCPVPGIGIQAMGLLRWACPALPPPAPEWIESQSAHVPVEHWGDRIDVLSVEEARRAAASPNGG